MKVSLNSNPFVKDKNSQLWNKFDKIFNCFLIHVYNNCLENKKLKLGSYKTMLVKPSDRKILVCLVTINVKQLTDLINM